MGTGWEQRLAQIDAELAELGEPTEGTETLRARIAALSRADLAELDRELEHMERLTRAAGRRSFAERASEGSATAEAVDMGRETGATSPVAQSEVRKGGASGARPSWAQALFDEAESAEDEEDELDLEVESETAREARGEAESSAGDASTEESDGLAALLEEDEGTTPNDAGGGFAPAELDASKQPVPASADAEAVRAEAESDEDEGYAEIHTGEVEVLVEEDEIVEEDESGLNQGSEL